MAKKSAGILLYRLHGSKTQVLLVHPGGPVWAKKDNGAWSIPKGEFGNKEDPLEAAKREFKEELGQSAGSEFIALNPVKLKSGKIVYAWAAKGEFNPEELKSNLFEMEWPPKSGSIQSFPEVDRASWFTLDEAKDKINIGQIALLEEMEKIIR
jgi:predicted NUDIX family NTP pyrophosphohydrolase